MTGVLTARPDSVGGRRDTRLLWQLLCYAVLGAVTTAASLGLYALFRTWLPLLVANLAAMVITTVFNTEANRRLRFLGSRAPTGLVHLQGLLVFALYFAFTSGVLLVLHWIVARPSTALELAVLASSSLVGGLARFALLRGWVFKRRTRMRAV